MFEEILKGLSSGRKLILQMICSLLCRREPTKRAVTTTVYSRRETRSIGSETSKIKMLDKEEENEELPRDAKNVKTLLKSMGIHEYEPRVIHQFLELWYRYVMDILTDAQVYSVHAGKLACDCEDIKLAIQTKVNCSFSQPPPREVLLELARNRNKIPLPKSLGGPGIPLPREQDTLISPNYQLAIPKKQLSPAVEETEDEEGANTNPNAPEEPKADQQQHPTQRVSFPLAAKHPR